jgi:hypothetical protein
LAEQGVHAVVLGVVAVAVSPEALFDIAAVTVKPPKDGEM